MIDSAHITSHSTLQQDDYIIGGPGPDFVFGDHGIIILNETKPYKLDFASTTDPNCTPGNDTIYLGDGDDIAFGGAFSDTIYGEAGQDIILGDFGLYNATNQFLPHQYVEPIIIDFDWAGADFIYGGDDDDFLMGQEDRDRIEGGGGSDDIIGGHSKREGEDTGDELFGDEDDDGKS